MQTFGAFLVSFLAATGLAAAVPAKVGTTVKNFSVDAVPNPNLVRNGAAALARAYIKFGKPVPENVAAAVASSKAAAQRRSNTGSATNTPTQYDSEYLTPVQIGTPAQTLNLDFDTGSSDLWVFSTQTKSAGSGHTKYNPSKSSTSKALSGATWSITYGDQSSSSGDVYTDVVSVGGVSFKKQAVESAEKVSSEFQTDSADGLLGLAFSSLNTVSPTPQKTFFDNVQSSLGQPVFTADLKHGTPGSYNFGYIDSNAYTGQITYAPVDSSTGWWTFDSTVGENSVTGIADTGTSLLLLPDAVLQDYYGGVNGAQNDQQAGGYTFSCDAQLPDFTFNIQGTDFTVPGAYLNFAPNDDSGETCFGGLQSDSGIGTSIYGDVALKAAFVVFDGGNTQIGWAAKNL